MRIVHFSDWHWSFERSLPEADLYVCTGDMLDNYGIARPAPGFPFGLAIEPEYEASRQRADVEAFVRARGFRRLLGSPDAPVVCVRGNHDFMDLAPLFEGCNLVHEFIANEQIEVCGLRVTGHRGIPYIMGTWADETPRPDLLDRFRAMPRADLYLTHYAPAGILDERLGLDGVASALARRHTDDSFIHCFGHIHEAYGVAQFGSGVFSNAATTWHVIEVP